MADPIDVVEQQFAALVESGHSDCLHSVFESYERDFNMSWSAEQKSWLKEFPKSCLATQLKKYQDSQSKSEDVQEIH